MYPVNVPLRDYQLSITKTSLFSNTLVALPTGLGKTLIAAVVMYNYFRWFPEGKIVFTAPSRPLVLQQIEACHNIVGIPQEWTIDMTGLMSPSRRSCFWKTKRVFFVTPQVLEKDIQSGTCLVKHLVCLVIDEAHRALGNYSYCVAVRELLSVPVQLRILALTATPGSKQQTIQNVIDNLHISTLEYRNESDHDVSPYVHNRKLELIEVAMGKDTIEINNLLLEAIQPFVTRLCAVGVLHNRDFQTLSPCELLNSRDKFRQAPPPALPHTKYGEVEGYFGVLITLYHIRKLLSSHGIRPAYEMLGEKLQQGNFARLLGRNEVIWKAKMLMEQSLSHGAPNPKLLKMIEILIDHFKSNSPKSSRVIIFSNFRGSVRDIMESLSKIGESVKATEFIGQSSGKALKGQTQKVQQAVLQKFRNGGYNVIVATSIGEEGLDIMEVDLVICFDANISPLRMIQRMGRTGRKHDGRVVVLACEGSELKGYLRKQANSKAVRKHMRNGGMHSFDFHSSPRMIPHICKPEVQFVELSIEQFVPRGRRMKDDEPRHQPTFMDKLSDAETELIAKYFHASREDTWKPSLIAFPNFQAFPSRVHNVMHSCRTEMLIDTMQRLQGLLFSKDMSETSSSKCLEAETVGEDDRSKSDLYGTHASQKGYSQRKSTEFESSPTGISRNNKENLMPDRSQKPPMHCFLFGADFVSVDACGRVSIVCVPTLPFMRETSPYRNAPSDSRELLKCMKQDSCSLRKSNEDYNGINVKYNAELSNSPRTKLRSENSILNSTFCNLAAHEEHSIHGTERTILQTPISCRNKKSSDNTTIVGCANTRTNAQTLLAKESNSDFRDVELSPRLTNLMERGIVPESPIGEFSHCSNQKDYVLHIDFKSDNEKCEPRPGRLMDIEESKVPINETFHSVFNSEGRSKVLYPAQISPAKMSTSQSSKRFLEKNVNTNVSNIESAMACFPASPMDEEIHTPCIKTSSGVNAKERISHSPVNVSPAKLCTILSPKRLCLQKIEEVKMNNIGSATDHVPNSPIDEETHTPLIEMNNNVNGRECISSSPLIEETHTPLVNLTNSCSKDWRMSSGETSKTVQQNHKFKRLRKYGDCEKRTTRIMKENLCGPIANLDRSFSNETCIRVKGTRGKQKEPVIHVKDFIEEEAEVSSEAEVSDDEEDDRENSSYGDSFIDDRLNPTAGSTQAEPSASAMMAIYRRSLLSQSPAEDQPNFLTDLSPPRRTAESKNSSGKISCSIQTPQTVLHSSNKSSGRNSISCQMGQGTISLLALPAEPNGFLREESKLESRKRKLSFHHIGSIPATCLVQECSLQLGSMGEESFQCQAENSEVNRDEFYDDQFYEGLDLDAVEAQATKLLRNKTELAREQNETVVPNPSAEGNLGLLNSPSFDLGI
ncbi:PREDICTED: uncharacterized protein LOC104596846 isoform X2 [Nelumbo nucifera]|nr:PREDICTED: uncharacterized protein LOC104596846 isoform X2 [Nelumbo nucifera]